ncbi:hypothetical protein V5T82_04365 [Magnetovibrio sp. PR-2]|uniref:hypothetical protein n=1 Tax=Magnetovibrio sp. PR-2 TaxID=3120356 RepID=UPI002FCE293B
MNIEDEGSIFRHFRRVVCDLYFAGFRNDRICPMCRDRERCHRLVEETLSFTKGLSESEKELQEVGDVNDTKDKK